MGLGALVGVPPEAVNKPRRRRGRVTSGLCIALPHDQGCGHAACMRGIGSGYLNAYVAYLPVYSEKIADFPDSPVRVSAPYSATEDNRIWFDN